MGTGDEAEAPGGRSGKRWLVLAVVLGLVQAVAMVFAGEKLFEYVVEQRKEAAERKERDAELLRAPPQRAEPDPIALLLPKPEPTPGRPWVEGAGFDAYGYPRSYANQLALRALLWAKRFEDLNEQLTWFQKEYEKDFKKEYWPVRAFGAFASPDRRLTRLIDEWARTHPKHFAPYMARAEHRCALAGHYRGSHLISKTSRLKLEGGDPRAAGLPGGQSP